MILITHIFTLLFTLVVTLDSDIRQHAYRYSAPSTSKTYYFDGAQIDSDTDVCISFIKNIGNASSAFFVGCFEKGQRFVSASERMQGGANRDYTVVIFRNKTPNVTVLYGVKIREE